MPPLKIAKVYIFNKRTYKYETCKEIRWHKVASTYESLYYSLARSNLLLRGRLVFCLHEWPTIFDGDLLHDEKELDGEYDNSYFMRALQKDRS